MSTTTATDPTLAAVRGEQQDRDAAEIRMLEAVIDWAVAHEGLRAQSSAFGEKALWLAGEGAPAVAEFATTSSPPPWVCPPMRGPGTSGGCWSCATASRRSGPV